MAVTVGRSPRHVEPPGGNTSGYLPLFAVLMAAAGLILAALAAYVGWRRSTPAGWSLAALLVAVAWWGLAYAAELSTDEIAGKALWGDLKYLGIGLLAPAWLVFVLQYLGRERWVTPRLLGVLAIEPVILMVLLAIPQTDDLVRFYLPTAAGDRLPIVGTGPVFWVNWVYTNLILVGASTLFVVRLSRLARSYARMAAVLVAAALFPWAANLLHNFEVGWFARLDLTPFAFIVTGGVLVWGLYRERLVDLTPMARSKVIETMTDAVFVLDAFGHVTDTNPAGSRLLHSTRGRLIGARLADLLPDLRPDAAAPPESELTLTDDGRQRVFDVLHQALTDPSGRAAGHLYVLREITERVRDRARLQRLLGQQTRVATALQATMVPDRLPQLPGCELVSRYEPAGDGTEVGGDFLDVFALDEQTWAFVLGDVSGAGAEAAAVSAAARYTIRALADGSRSPSVTLGEVNSRLLLATEAERHCTLVYGYARPAPEEGLLLTLSLAGHHQPLIRRTDGSVEPVGRWGMPLALFEAPELHDTTVRLGPGEVLCLFTDGLVESRRDDEMYEVERVADVLVEHRDQSLDDLAAGLVSSVRAFHGGHLADDLALLLLRPLPTGWEAPGS